MPRGRQKILVSEIELREKLEEVEEQGPFPNRGQLHEAVAATPWAKSRKLRAQMVAVKMKEWGIVVKTPKGQRGRQKGVAVVKSGTEEFMSLGDKYTLCANKGNWILVGSWRKYFAGFRAMFKFIAANPYVGLDVEVVIPLVRAKLASVLNHEIELVGETAEEKGKSIDQGFRVNFCSPKYDDVYDRLFGKE
tara:strand:- start:27 stop:602 length:576 start_codon:yes stop_codon:yes gene_type:complete